jgi:hypothetical protein
MHDKFFRKDSRKNQGYTKEVTKEALSDDPWAAAVAEIEAKMKKASAGTLSAPTMTVTGGLRPATYGVM